MIAKMGLGALSGTGVFKGEGVGVRHYCILEGMEKAGYCNI